MIRVAFLVAALALPALCRADQVWRWEDAAGRLHYSNVRAHVPSYAEPLRGSIGIVHMPAVAPMAPAETIRVPMTEPPTTSPHRGARRHTGAVYCGGFGYPFGLSLNASDPSELVKQASALDALGIRWRGGCCE